MSRNNDEDALFAQAMETLGVQQRGPRHANARPEEATADELEAIRRLALGAETARGKASKQPQAPPKDDGNDRLAALFSAHDGFGEDAEFAAAMAALDGPAPDDSADAPATDPDPYADRTELARAHVGTPKALRRRIKQGLITHDSELDLHGQTQLQARESVEHFLSDAVAANQSVVRVITGRGLHSEGGQAILQQAVADWLDGPLRAFTYTSLTAPMSHGGEGMRYIFLRRFAGPKG